MRTVPTCSMPSLPGTSPVTESPPNRQALRLHMREQRRALTPDQRADAAIGIMNKVRASPEYAGASTLTAYLAMPGELEMDPLIQAAWQDGKSVYLPLIQGRAMQFLHFTEDTPVQAGPFGIRQPLSEPDAAIEAQALDLVLVPLLAFDARGNRLGMGGGYYDRTFEFCLRAPPRRPVLAGVAYAFQQVEHLVREDWDVPLDLIITERSLIRPDPTDPRS